MAKFDLEKASKRVAAMESDRSSFFPLWQDLTRNFLVHRGRYDLDDNNDGKRRDNQIQNNTPVLSLRTLTSGMMSGVTSPARPWFRLSTGDNKLDKVYEVRVWLHEITSIMYRVFAMSNLYNSLQTYYNELCNFGTAAMAIYDDDDKFIRFETQTAGQYACATGATGEIEALSLRRKITVNEIVRGYGIENCPQTVKTLWENGQLTERVEVLMLVEPNDDRDRTSPFAKDMPFRSVTWVVSSNDKPLRESGFLEFPYTVTRWDTAPGDVYGTNSPAITSLGDALSLQIAERDILTAMDYEAEPPFLADISLRRALGDGSPRPGRTYYTENVDAAFKSLYHQYRPQVNFMDSVASRIEGRIRDAFFVDLFMMLSNTDRREMTAREVAEKHEEKLLQLGPVLERVHNELLDPLINRAFGILQRKDILPEPPEILQGRELRVEYISILAQAQRLVSLQGIERMLAFTGQLAQFDESASMYPNVPHMIAEYAEAVGVAPELMYSDEEVAEKMQAIQQQQAQEQAIADMQQGAELAKTASQADMGGDNALSTIMRNAGLA